MIKRHYHINFYAILGMLALLVASVTPSFNSLSQHAMPANAITQANVESVQSSHAAHSAQVHCANHTNVKMGHDCVEHLCSGQSCGTVVDLSASPRLALTSITSTDPLMRNKWQLLSPHLQQPIRPPIV
ncbi:hypothetical protein [Vibrio ezurae]|uniref:Uncharacterized protein n=1 Tax=Vibrio ezurae NBRC 102218 TaxID=1219080 RepID=U3B0V2_9VIBR|nr:hypothetical protein [Vibrio ezurae]GAD79102.1 hypothetical protein VEZ01S_08_01380 [Vibrio ezurae NBRC 102218]